jgi:hypothetical protein
MSAGNQNYQGAIGTGGELIQIGFEKFIKVYNDTAGTISNGAVYFLSWLKDADSLSPSARPTLDALATSAIYRQVVVVNNTLNSGAGTILDANWGFVQVRGYCPDVNTDVTSVAIDRFLQGKNATATAADDGTAYTIDSFAITVGAIFSTSHIEATLFGQPTNIG